MPKPTNSELILMASKATKGRRAPSYLKVGTAGCAIVTNKGSIYTGVNIKADCDIGLCAENNAIANMITNREYRIDKIVAVHRDGTVLPPCGRCRELIYQTSKENHNTLIVLGRNDAVRLRELLPNPWQEKLHRAMHEHNKS